MPETSAARSRAGSTDDGESALFASTAEILGGAKVWKQPPRSQLEVHNAIARGFPGKALVHVFEHVRKIPVETLSKVVGVSYRTVQRRAEAPLKPLSEDQSYRLWKFAEIFAEAAALQGTPEAAEEWLTQPQMALDRHTPLDLMTTLAGAEMVEELLIRLKYDVYT